MMKIKVEKLYLVSLVLVLILFNCQDNAINTNDYAFNKVNRYNVSLSNFDKKLKLEDYLKTLKSKNKNFESRFVYDSINDFTVYTDNFTVLENGDRQWLIFNIFRNFKNNLLENLVLQSSNGGDYSPYLYQYDFDQTDFQNLNTGLPVNDIYSKTNIISLNSYDTNVFARDGGAGTLQIYSLPSGRCGIVDHIWEENGLIYVSFIVVPCDSEPTGGNASQAASNGGSGPNNYYSSTDWNGIFNNFLGNNHYYDQYGNGGSTQGTNADGGFISLPNDLNDYYLNITYPLVPPQVDNNIVFLNNITSNTRAPYKQKIADLKDALNETLESGYEFFNTNGNITYIQAESTAEDGIHFNIPTLYSFIRIHNHPIGIDPFFSEKDIIGMSELFSVKDDLGAADAEEATSMLVTPNGLFALRVNDPDKVVAFNQRIKGFDENYKAERDNFIKDYKDFVVFAPQVVCNGCMQDEYFDLIDEYFVTLLDYWNTGLSLYKGTENTDGTYTWKKVEDN